MPRKNEGLEKHTLNFYAGDIERLRRLYPEQEIGFLLRNLLRQHLEAEEAKVPPAPPLQMNV